MNFTKWIELESFVDSYTFNKINEEALKESLIFIFESFNKEIKHKYHENDEYEDDEGPVELDDPFDGDENAEPLYADKKEIERVLSSSGSRDKEDKINKYVKKLVNALKIIRNNAVKERANKIEFIKKINEQIKKQKEDDDYISDLDIDDALPILVDLGYITKKQLEKISKEEIDVQFDEIEPIIELASNEKGNDVYFSVEHENISRAQEDAFNSMQKLYKSRIDSLARSNQSQVGSTIGHQYFEPEEISNELFLKITNFISKRKWKGGKLLGWEEGNTIEHFFVDENIDPMEIYKYFKGALRFTAGNLRTSGKKTMNPKEKDWHSRKYNLHKSKFKKIVLGDIKESNFEFYENYLKAISATSLVKNKVVYLNAPFHSRSPDAIIMADENTPILPQSEDDKIRLEIIKSIEAEYHNTPSAKNYLSLDPKNINSTLENYVDYFLRKKENPIIHASSLTNDDDDEIDLGSYVGTDDDVSRNRPFDAATQNQQQSSQMSGNVMLDFLKPYMLKAINQISREGKQTLRGNIGANEALSLCIKFGFECSLETMKTAKGDIIPKMVTVYEEPIKDIDPAIENYFKSRIDAGSWSWDEFCKNGFNQYGIRLPLKIAELWQNYPKLAKVEDKLSYRTPGSIQEYLYGTSRPDLNNTKPGGLRKMCEKVRRMIPFL